MTKKVIERTFRLSSLKRATVCQWSLVAFTLFCANYLPKTYSIIFKLLIEKATILFPRPSLNYLNFANFSSNHNCCAEPTSCLPSNNNINNIGWQAPCLCLSAPLLDKWNANYLKVNMQPSITDQFYYFLFRHHPKMHPEHSFDLNISHFCVIYLFCILCVKALTAESFYYFAGWHLMPVSTLWQEVMLSKAVKVLS